MASLPIVASPARVERGAVAHPFPAKRVAAPWHDAAPPLALGEALPLLGGNGLNLGAIPMELALDWAPEIQAAVAQACLEQVRAGRPWFTLPPIAIMGEHGLGRTLIAKRIATCAGVPLVVVDVSGRDGADHLRSARIALNTRLPSPIVLTMAAARCANPVVLVTGVDAAEEAALDVLQAMSDPVSAGSCPDDALRATIDLAAVTWIVETSSPLGLPRQLSHFQRIDVRLDADARRLRALTVVIDLFADLGVGAHEVEGLGAALMEPLHAASTSAAVELRRIAEMSLSAATSRTR